jgi:NADP-dependent 3-hydroxy acid dehydrogenase YdfG
MTAIRGSAAAVTGAASGIGRALALELAARGCDVALADRDEAGLQTVAAEINRTHSQKVTAHRVDVSEPQQIADFAQAATSAHPGLNIVVNNAGVALLGQFNEIDQAQMDWLMNINFWGVVHATRAFLPHLARQREAHIVNLSSIFGIIAPPGADRLCGGEIRGARLFRKFAARAAGGGEPSAIISGASRRGFHQYRAQLPRRHRRHRQCAPRAIDRAFRCHRKNHAGRCRAAHYSGHREQPAADIDW